MKAPRSLLLRLLLWPFLQVKRLLSLQLRLQWQGRRPRFVLEDPSQIPTVPPPAPKARKAGPATANPPSTQSAAASENDCDMHRELHALLAQHGKVRQLMRHLAFIERQLKLAGPDSLDTQPLDVLKKAGTQLEELVSDWSSPGLAELRLRLTMLVSDKEEAARNFVPTNSALSDFDTQRVQVEEASESVFNAAERSWLGRMPAELQKKINGGE